MTGREQKDFKILSDVKCKLTCCISCTFCCRAAIKESLKSCYNLQPLKSLKYVKDVSSVDQFSFVQKVMNVLVGVRLQYFWETWAALGAGPKVIRILREGYILPFQIRPDLTRSPTIISGHVHPIRNCYPMKVLNALM